MAISEKRYYGMYLGIVVQNNDPEKRGRVKVFIPHISAGIYQNWNENKEDKNFAFVDANWNEDLAAVLPYLKKVLPWAEMAQPIFGGSASGRYNALTKKGTTSDSNAWRFGLFMEEGFRPTQNYSGENRVFDAFQKVDETSENKLINPNAYQYSPSDYSNLARGLFSPINVGAHVWIFFENGDPMSPIVFAISYGQEDWKRIYSMSKRTDYPELNTGLQDYPASYENLSVDDQGYINHDTQTFRSKHVWNSNKHTIELVDTDHRELLKFTHYSGSFMEFNNAVTTRLATSNDQLMVLGDQFLTVKKSQGIYIAGYQEKIIMGDRVTRLGSFVNREKYARRVLNALRESHDWKRLFEMYRTPHYNYINSPLQELRPTDEWAKCPVCQGTGEKFGEDCITCNGSGDSPSTQWGAWDLKEDDLVQQAIARAQKKIIDLDYEANFGNGGDDILHVTGNQVITVGTILNDLESFRIDPVGKIRNAETYVAPEGTYVAMEEVPLIEYVDVDSIPGGDVDMTVGNKYRLTVGSKGVHIKTTGPVDIYGTIMNIQGHSVNISSDYEVLIDGGQRVEIRGDVINLKPHTAGREYVLLDGNVGVANNLTICGGAHIEGELSLLHLSAPSQIGWTSEGGWPLHSHIFYHPAWSLYSTAKDVREQVGKMMNVKRPAPNGIDFGFWRPH